MDKGGLSVVKDVRLVEIEIHSMCNRDCKWCPNTRFKRDKLIQMSENMYIKILRELKFNKYKGIITYSRYNEPMLDINLLKKRLNQAKRILPTIKLVSNTNGDYLTKDNLEGLHLDELSVMDYDCIGKRNCLDKLNNVGAQIINIDRHFIHAKFNGMKILYFADWPKHIKLEDRGGFFGHKPINYISSSTKESIDIVWRNNKDVRTSPCMEPTYFIGIDYNGNVMPCCHMRSDNPDHEKYILGNVKDNSIYEIYNSNRARKIREAAHKGEFDLLKPCKFCQKKQGRYTRDNFSIDYE